MSDELVDIENQTTILEDLYYAMRSFLTKERPTASVGGTAHPASDFLYVPDPDKPSTWKLPVFDLAHMRAAAEALTGGFRGNKVSMPSSAIASCKRKLRGMFSKMGEKAPDSLNKENGLMIWKEKDGTYRWFAMFSNNFRDEDNPPEIISKESHLAFNQAVEAGKLPYPELWHWHVKGSKWGVADWLNFDESTGIEMASGYVLKGHEAEAESLSDTFEPIGVSHGMPPQYVQYSKEDSSIITRHITTEISDLPLWAAANKLTSFVVLKENEDMAIPDKKREYLTEHGVTEEGLQEIEALNERLGKEAKETGLESKEKEPVAEKTETPVAETPVEEEKKETTPVAQTPVYATNQEVADAIVLATKAITDIFEAKFKEMQDSFATRLEEVKSKEQNLGTIPTASLAALVAQGMRSIGTKETQVNKNSALAKSAPEETPAADEPKSVVNTGNPAFDGSISRIIGK
jgi:hypothetical protein